MKTNADDNNLKVQNRTEAPIHDLKFRPGRMKKLLPIQIEKIKKCLTDLQHEQFGSAKYVESLDHMWDGHFLLVADNRADFCKRLGLSPVVAERLVGKLRQPEPDTRDNEKNEPINTGDHPEKSPTGTSSDDMPESRPPNTQSSTEGAVAVSLLPKPKTPPESDRDRDEASGNASAVPVTDNTNAPKKRPTKKSQQNASDVPAMGNTQPNEPLGPVEAERFLQCEEIIRVNVKSLFALGEALQEIRDKRLYRESFKSFEAYCRRKWDFTRAWAAYQIRAACVLENLATVVDNEGLREPVNERQVRPLASLEPDQQSAAWKRACELAGESEVNHHHVEQAVKELKCQSEGPAEHPKSSKRKSSEAPTQATPDDQNSARPQSFPPSDGDDTMSGINAGSKPCKFSFDSVAELDADECLELWVQLLDTIQRTTLQSEPAKHKSESERTLDEPGIQRAARRAMDATRSTANKRRKYEQPMFWRKVIQALAIEVKMEFLGCFAKPSQRGDSNPESKVRGKV